MKNDCDISLPITRILCGNFGRRKTNYLIYISQAATYVTSFSRTTIIHFQLHSMIHLMLGLYNYLNQKLPVLMIVSKKEEDWAPVM